MTTPHTPADILRLARAKIDAPEKWTKGALARNGRGVAVPPRSSDAICWCTAGALQAVCEDIPARIIALNYIQQCDETARIDGITVWNDSGTYERTISGFDRAIQLADQGGQGE